MELIRLRTSINLNGDHSLEQQHLNDLKPAIEKAIASVLPDYLSVTTVKVTRINEGKPNTPTEEQA